MKHKEAKITWLISIIGVIISVFRIDNNLGWLGVLTASGLTFLIIGMYLLIIGIGESEW